MDKPVPVIPATTSSGWTSNGVVIVNTLAAWLVILVALWRHSDSLTAVTSAMTMVILMVFAVERGLRHLDLRAGADGVTARVSDELPAAVEPPTTVEKETSAPA